MSCGMLHWDGGLKSRAQFFRGRQEITVLPPTHTDISPPPPKALAPQYHIVQRTLDPSALEGRRLEIK